MGNITENTTETMERKTSEDSFRKKSRGASPKNDGPWTWLLVVLWGSSIVCLLIYGIGKFREYRAGLEYEALAKNTVLSFDEETPRTVLDQIAETIGEEDQKDDPDSKQEGEQEATPEPKRDPMQVLQDLGVPIPENKAVDFETLQKETNEDIYAWIYIPNTNIDYPVLQHPTDNEFYLWHNLDGSKGYPSCIYTENYNSREWTDPVTVLYGHVMATMKTMFHQIHRFREADFFEENQYIYIYTPEKLLVYRVFAAEIHSNEHILLSHDFSDQEQFLKFFSEIQDPTGGERNVREGVEIEGDSKIIVLSTCMKEKNSLSKRCLVFGVLLNE